LGWNSAFTLKEFHMGVIADLFLLDEAQTVEQRHCTLEPHERAIASLKRVLLARHPCQLQFSSGKDSSCCANLMLSAAIEVMAEGHPCPPLHVCHADTTIENPLVRALADRELDKMRAFAARHNIPLTIHVGRPTLSARYAPRIIGGRALPPFPSGRADCTTDWKIAPSERISRRILESLPDDGPQLVTVIGTRSSESLARQINTAARKESAHELWYGPNGEARLSPASSTGRMRTFGSTLVKPRRTCTPPTATSQISWPSMPARGPRLAWWWRT